MYMLPQKLMELIGNIDGGSYFQALNIAIDGARRLKTLKKSRFTADFRYTDSISKLRSTDTRLWLLEMSKYCVNIIKLSTDNVWAAYTSKQSDDLKHAF